jgi:hypothetical protein
LGATDLGLIRRSSRGTPRVGPEGEKSAIARPLRGWLLGSSWSCDEPSQGRRLAYANRWGGPDMIHSTDAGGPC